MGKYGVKICNIQASTLYENNIGVRDHFEYTKAMFTNSLLLDFLQDNGLKIYNKNSTRDIICLQFDWGSRSYKEELTHLVKLSKKAREENDREKRLMVIKLYKKAKMNKVLYDKKSKDEIRNDYYVNGAEVVYITRDKNGKVKKEERIHYKMLYRSTGKAKKGTCMFIRDRLYKKAYKFMTMGLKIPKRNAPIVELSGYIPLVSSTIVDRIQIDPKNILILKDVDSFFKTKVISVETNENKECVAKTIEDYELKNTLFDGQGLIDSSVFPSWGNGYILLRHHFCKMACFNSNIQLFFRDYFGKEYDTATVEDMWGNKHLAKDIKLITTDNAMKWIKFDVTYNYWCDRVNENNNTFGIVKTAHKSKLGNAQKMSYQMVNALNIDVMDGVVEKSIDYIIQLKTNDDVFLDYLCKNKNFSNDYEVLVALVNQDRTFLRSEYFRNRKKEIIRTYVKNFKRGKIIQTADNLTIVGNPYAMLLHSVGEDVEKDTTFAIEENAIQCYSELFNDGEYLAGFRNPFNSKNNMDYLHNVLMPTMSKYFNLGECCIATNNIHTDFQDRNNGSDTDSDFLFVTNQPQVVECAKDSVINYPTIVNNIPKEKNQYNNTLEDYALVDNNLAQSSMIIGESSNLAQLALTYTYNFKDTKYQDYVCILSVLAQVAIDSAKRRFDINLGAEVKRIKKDMNIKENGLPIFWGLVKKINRKRINKSLVCPMNYLSTLKIPEFKPQDETLPMSDFFVKYELNENRRKCKKVEKFIENYSLTLFKYKIDDDNKENDDCLLLRADFEDMINEISQIYLSKNYLGLMSWLVDRAFLITDSVYGNLPYIKTRLNTNKAILLKTLYQINSKNFLTIFGKNIKK